MSLEYDGDLHTYLRPMVPTGYGSIESASSRNHPRFDHLGQKVDHFGQNAGALHATLHGLHGGPFNFYPSGWLRASALPCRLISLVGVKRSCLRIDKQAFTPHRRRATPNSPLKCTSRSFPGMAFDYVKYFAPPPGTATFTFRPDTPPDASVDVEVSPERESVGLCAREGVGLCEREGVGLCVREARVERERGCRVDI